MAVEAAATAIGQQLTHFCTRLVVRQAVQLAQRAIELFACEEYRICLVGNDDQVMFVAFHNNRYTADSYRVQRVQVLMLLLRPAPVTGPRKEKPGYAHHDKEYRDNIHKKGSGAAEYPTAVQVEQQAFDGHTTTAPGGFEHSHFRRIGPRRDRPVIRGLILPGFE